MWTRQDAEFLQETSDEAAGDSWVGSLIRLHQVSSSDVTATAGDFFGDAGSFSQVVTKLEIPCNVHWIRGQKRLRMSGRFLELEDGDVLVQDIPFEYKDVIRVGDVFDVFNTHQTSTNEMIVQDFYPANSLESSFILTGRRHK